MLALLLVGFGNSFAVGAILGLLVPYAVEQLDLADAQGRIGVLYSAGGVGSLLAGVLLSRLFRIERVKWLIPGTLACSSLLIDGLVASTSFVSALVLMTAFSWSIATTIAVGITYRQLTAPDDLRGSADFLGRMISWGGQPFGAAIGGLIAVVTAVHVAYTVAALVMAASAIVASVLLRPWTALVEPFSKAGPQSRRSSRRRERNLNLDARSGALLRIRPRTSRRPEVGESPTRSRHCHGVGAVPSLEPDLATPPPQRDARSQRRPRIHDRHRRSAADTAPADRHPSCGPGRPGPSSAAS